jgi:hypothetical protein
VAAPDDRNGGFRTTWVPAQPQPKNGAPGIMSGPKRPKTPTEDEADALDDMARTIQEGVEGGWLDVGSIDLNPDDID